MFLLSGRNAKGEEVKLFILGADQGKLKEGEPICDIDPSVINSLNPDEYAIHVRKQVGVVKIRPSLQFIYTDPDFIKSVGYNKETGQSSLDGKVLRNLATGESYLYIDGKRPQHFSFPKIDVSQQSLFRILASTSERELQATEYNAVEGAMQKRT